ncbi:MAG TPA: hypothetical protein VEW68_10705, partial [Patescibacteria group bacterium]|nr:hypothetical protein [Patescibacteria group bacterium]
MVQWGVDQLYSGLQELKSKIDAVAADLNADKAQLAQMYDTARQNMDPARDVYLAPLIHQNTVLRLTYLKPIQDKFNSTVAAASKLIRGA